MSKSFSFYYISFTFSLPTDEDNSIIQNSSVLFHFASDNSASRNPELFRKSVTILAADGGGRGGDGNSGQLKPPPNDSLLIYAEVPFSISLLKRRRSRREKGDGGGRKGREWRIMKARQANERRIFRVLKACLANSSFCIKLRKWMNIHIFKWVL